MEERICDGDYSILADDIILELDVYMSVCIGVVWMEIGFSQEWHWVRDKVVCM